MKLKNLYIWDKRTDIELEVDITFGSVHYQPAERATLENPSYPEEWEFYEPTWDESQYTKQENEIIKKFMDDYENWQVDAEDEARKQRDGEIEEYLIEQYHDRKWRNR